MARVDYFDDPDAPSINSVLPSVTVAIRNDDGDLLLIHKIDNDLWAVPGGGHDPGERIVDTAIREVKEETGLQVRRLHAAMGLPELPSGQGQALPLLPARDEHGSYRPAVGQRSGRGRDRPNPGRPSGNPRRSEWGVRRTIVGHPGTVRTADH
jgi:8-oxo-dGTP pyrophosphatase MutT (NUDIX family)